MSGSGSWTWKACENCRKRKTKCNGNTPCSYCTDRQLTCFYANANDNAARSRQEAINLGVQYDRLDSLYSRMELMMTRLSTAVGVLEDDPESTHLPPTQATVHIAQNASLPSAHSEVADDEHIEDNNNDPNIVDIEHHAEQEKKLERLSRLVLDTNNTQRYIGGPSNALSMDIIQNNSSNQSQLVGAPEVKLSALMTSALYGASESEPLGGFPSQENKDPPRYLSDVLVNLFLTRLNPMFPILHEELFVFQYKQYLNRTHVDHRSSPFRSVLYAVYACAFNMLDMPRWGHEQHAGKRYFNLALFDQAQNLGCGGIEEVQCLSILSTCAASWNRCADGWKLAGQAVRAAQDLGLHIDFGESDQANLRSRVWWCVYTLNSCLSTCLGRNTGVHGASYDCKFPNVEHNDISTPTRTSPVTSAIQSETSPVLGFVALARGCEILDTINNFAVEMGHMSHNNYEHALDRDYQFSVLEMQLSTWVRDQIPPSIKYAANDPEHHDGINLATCTLAFMIHAVAVINLNLPLIEKWDIDAAMFDTEEVGPDSVCKVITAARGIIRGSELVATNIPPSHYLALCVHLLYISGSILFKAFQLTRIEKAAQDIQKCVKRLVELDAVYPGASLRSEALQQLLSSDGVVSNQ